MTVGPDFVGTTLQLLAVSNVVWGDAAHGNHNHQRPGGLSARVVKAVTGDDQIELVPVWQVALAREAGRPAYTLGALATLLLLGVGTDGVRRLRAGPGVRDRALEPAAPA